MCLVFTLSCQTRRQLNWLLINVLVKMPWRCFKWLTTERSQYVQKKKTHVEFVFGFCDGYWTECKYITSHMKWLIFWTADKIWRWKWSCSWINSFKRLKKGLEKFRLDRESNPDPFAMTGRNALSMKLIKPTGQQAHCDFVILYTRWWKWHEIFWTTDKDMKVEMILAVE